MATDPPELVVADAKAWERWLRKHQDDPDGVTLILAKKGVTEPTSLTYDEALDVALCYGWIDGRVNRLDDATYKQRFTPRRAKSSWSKRNIGITERLVSEGRMQARGQAEIDKAKADGRWEAAYLGPSTIEVPTELTKALAENPEAKAMFDVLTSQNRYALLYRLQTAKRPETKARLLDQFVDMLARGETLYPQKRRP